MTSVAGRTLEANSVIQEGNPNRLFGVAEADGAAVLPKPRDGAKYGTTTAQFMICALADELCIGVFNINKRDDRTERSGTIWDIFAADEEVEVLEFPGDFQVIADVAVAVSDRIVPGQTTKGQFEPSPGTVHGAGYVQADEVAITTEMRQEVGRAETAAAAGGDPFWLHAKYKV